MPRHRLELPILEAVIKYVLSRRPVSPYRPVLMCGTSSLRVSRTLSLVLQHPEPTDCAQEEQRRIHQAVRCVPTIPVDREARSVQSASFRLRSHSHICYANLTRLSARRNTFARTRCYLFSCRLPHDSRLWPWTWSLTVTRLNEVRDDHTTYNNRLDTTLADVFNLLSLFFLTIGKTRECPATYSQIASMRVSLFRHAIITLGMRAYALQIPRRDSVNLPYLA